MEAEKLEELVVAFKGATPQTMSMDRGVVRAALEVVLTIVEREHHVALEKRADAAYERGIADVQARFSQEIAEAYARGAKDAQALTDLGF